MAGLPVRNAPVSHGECRTPAGQPAGTLRVDTGLRIADHRKASAASTRDVWKADNHVAGRAIPARRRAITLATLRTVPSHCGVGELRGCRSDIEFPIRLIEARGAPNEQASRGRRCGSGCGVEMSRERRNKDHESRERVGLFAPVARRDAAGGGSRSSLRAALRGTILAEYQTRPSPVAARRPGEQTRDSHRVRTHRVRRPTAAVLTPRPAP